MRRILVSDEQYLQLRQESREALKRLGVANNPCFTDNDILYRLGKLRELEVEPYDEMLYPEYAPEMFRDTLGAIVGLEPPAQTHQILGLLKCVRYEPLH